MKMYQCFVLTIALKQTLIPQHIIHTVKVLYRPTKNFLITVHSNVLTKAIFRYVEALRGVREIPTNFRFEGLKFSKMPRTYRSKIKKSFFS